MFFKRIISFFLAVSVFFGYNLSFQKPLKDAQLKIDYGKVERDMTKYAGVHSEIKDLGGVPALFVNGKPFTSVAYMTYLEKFNCYDDFNASGYDFFSVPVLFSGRWISITDGFTPFKKGIFDEKGKADFTPLDEAINKILAVNPNACIIPRVNISMPEWWEKENPEDVNIRADGTTCRESFYSDKWRNQAEKMLREFVQYINKTEYASHIIGYQIAGGNTEEWFHFDLNGGYCKNAEKGFKNFLEKYYPDIEYRGLPDLSKLNKKANYFKDEYLTRYLEYSSFAVADAITYLASAVKQETGNNVVVGSFYGYSLEVTNPLWGTHALNILLNDPNIDFICSPNSYLGNRGINYDCTEMYPADSVRLHGKMCFQECDIRTHLTVHLNEKDPLTDPNHNLSASIWDGLETKEQAINSIRKSFARQLTKGNGLWWFDMWGGWFADKDIMDEMAQYREIYADSLTKENRKFKTDVALFVDESSYKYMTNQALRNAVYNQRQAMGLIGTPYDTYDVFDFEQVYQNYKTVIFASGAKTENMQRALKLCRKNNIPYIMPTGAKMKFSAKELRAFCEANGVCPCCETEDIIYLNDNYAAICAVSEGEKTIKLEKECTVFELLTENAQEYKSDKITVQMKKGEVRLFQLTR